MRQFEREELKMEIIKHLVNEGYICPTLLPLDDLKDRVSTKDRQYIPELTDDLENKDLLRKTGDLICVADVSGARNYVRDKGGLI
jgi:hypothetical protein